MQDGEVCKKVAENVRKSYSRFFRQIQIDEVLSCRKNEIRFVMHLLDDKICSKVLTIEHGKNISGKNSDLFIWNPKPTPSCLQGSPNC